MKEIREDKGRTRPVVEGDFQCDEQGNSIRDYEILSIVGVVDGESKSGYISKKDVPIGTPITDSEYWYPFNVILVPKGDKGDKGDDGQPLIIRVSSDGQSLEVSDDGGQTWYTFEKNFSKLRVLGYVNSIANLPRSANIGDIYGVLQQPEQEGEVKYTLYINTITDWLEDYIITKVYDYDTELPSSAANGTTVLVPVDYLTLDKQKIDGYKVYRFGLDKNGWVLILDTAEIYASKDDIINDGDNVYALVQGSEEGTYALYRRNVEWVLFGTNSSITYLLVQNVEDGTETNILSGNAVKDAIELLDSSKVDKEEGKSLIDENYIKEVENPEFVRIYLDNQHKILWGIQKDGNIFYGAGVPSQIINYIEQRIADLSLDEYEDIVQFLDGLEKGDKTLSYLLDHKLDIIIIDNTEFLRVITDSQNKMIECIDVDGNKILSGNVCIKGKISIGNNIETQNKIEYNSKSSEYIQSVTDSKKKLLEGIKIDGSKYIAGNLQVDGNIINKGLEKQINDDVEEKVGGLDKNALNAFFEKDNTEYIELETDSEGKVLAGRNLDGETFEKVGFSTPKISIDGHIVKNIKDSERRIEITIDSKGKIVSYRTADGTKVESKLRIENLVLSEDVENKIKTISSENVNIRKFNIPKYGTVDIVSETFYLTSNSGYSDINGVYPIQVYPNTQANAQQKKICVVYYVKSTLTDNGDGTYSVNANSVPLVFYAAKEVVLFNGHYYVKSITKVNDRIYLTDTLDKATVEGQIVYSVNSHSVEINEQVVIEEQQTLTNAIEVTQLVDKPNYLAWPISKTPEHYCTATINFGHYLRGTFSVGVKYQGSSTILNRKRNFRITFYKNNTFAKKNKIKIGEMVRLSGYNLKAFYGDRSKVKEFIMNRIFMAIWEKRDIYDQYPWNKDNIPYTGATGMIKSFPIRLSIGGEFYGLMMFGLKKDEKNYMLDGTDESGIFVCANGGNGVWAEADHTWYDEEMLDEMSQSTADALDEFTKFFSGRLTDDNDNLIPCDRDTMPERMSVIDWIDYFICLQVFVMADNTCRNMVLYTKSDKKKFYPFFYDLDLSMRFDDNDSVITMDMLHPPVEVVRDMSVWQNFYDNYQDEIINRYVELRNTILNKNYITAVYKDAISGIPSNDNILEQQTWEISDIHYFEKIMNDLFYRLNWLDETFFKI